VTGTGAPRIEPLQKPYGASVAAALAQWMPPGAEVEPLALFRTLLVHEGLAGRMRPLGAGILGRGAMVAPALREVMIHRTCALMGNEYEWGVHARVFGLPLGFDETQLHSTVHGGAGDACWDERQTSVLRLAEELHATSNISDELWQQLQGQFEAPQILELIVTAGWYHVIGYVCNGLRIAHEDWAVPFPDAGPGS
jgi:4-carboxymuconolactone decarboxylase